ncbi:MAG: hypothetical protein OHK0029_23260 [Armatimonadaceae bacterium]
MSEFRDSPLDLWNEPLTPQERHHLLDSVAEAIRQRGLQTPALFFIEMHRPLGFLAAQGLIVLTPMLAPLLGLDRVQKLGRLLSDPEAVEELVRLLETPAEPNTMIREEGNA